jgi:hypothetical protein
MLTKSASILICSCLLIAYLSCTQNKAQADKVDLDSTAYPKQPYSSITLFTLDTSKSNRSLDNEEGYRKRNELEYAGRSGYTFIDSFGKPKTKYYKSYELNSAQISQIKSFLVQKPCTSDEITDTNCAPTYRNVFVFYDATKKSIAQVHVCFQCRKTIFKPYKDYMCAFDMLVDHSKFEAFASSIKENDKDLNIEPSD